MAEAIPASEPAGRANNALRGASLLILLQVISRAITFVANQVLLRFLTAQLLGISTQLEVYYLSVLFFARESLRVAIQRGGGPTTDEKDDGPPASATTEKKRDENSHSGGNTAQAQAQAAVNLAYISIALGVVVAVVLGWVYLSSVNAETVSSTAYFIDSVYIYAFAAVIELLSEPAFVVMQIRLQFGARASAESIATFAKCIVTLASAVGGSRKGLDLGAVPFALGQLSYGISLLLVYAWFGLSLTAKDGFSLLPRQLPYAKPDGHNAEKPVASREYALSYFYRPTLRLATSMMAQSIVKHILTQGDTFLVSILSSPTAQGVYALANNYGGLAARLVFQPIEESSRSYFSRLLADAKSLDTKADKGRSASGAAAPSVQRAATDLRSILRIYILFSLPIVALGSTAAPFVLSLIAGPRWAASGAGAALAAYVWYIPLLAINGVAEAFVASVASEREVNRQSGWMGAFSLAFAIAGFVFLRLLDLGAIGLVLANSINMACRITWCEIFISAYFKRLGVSWDIKDLLPSPLAVLAAAVTSQVVPRLVGEAGSTMALKDLIFNLIKIAGVAVPFVAIL